MFTPGTEDLERERHRARRLARSAFGFMSGLARQLTEERDRWILWSPVLLGVGIAIYFGLKSEPPAWSGTAGLAVAAILYGAMRRWPVLALGATVLALTCLGFAAAQLRVSLVAAPVVGDEIEGTTVSGRICEMTLLPTGYRVYLDHLTVRGLAPDATPARIRLRVAAATGDFEPGQWVEVRARLGPISQPVAPGAFDFQRDTYFERIGAVGFAFGAPGAATIEQDLGWLAGLPCRLSALRLSISHRIRAVLPGDTGAIGAALISGDQGAISKPVLQDMRDSGLAHLLSISGLHIGLVAGLLFVSLRRLLCLFPRVALYHPIKKWGAIAALVGTLFYVALAGAPVPTVRAFIMASMFLLAVVLDRTAISMPPIAWAAVVVLLVSPEELTGASFQMSFAAVVALVAAYESTQTIRLRWRAEAGWGRRAGLYLAGLVFTSLIATAATSPYSIFHFNRLATYGVIANVIAVPLSGLWIMPWAVLAVLFMPFGLEHLALIPMGWGIDVIILLARTIADWSGVVWLVPTMPNVGLVLVTIGGLWLCLWQRAWRGFGLPMILCGFLTLALVRPPSILVSGDARFFAVADASGQLLLSTARARPFVVDTWLRRSAEEAAGTWPVDGYGADDRLACDSLGCIYKAQGRTVALVQQPMALAEDCKLADVVVSFVPVRVPCRPNGAVIDRFDLWRNGTYAIWIGADGEIETRSVQEERGERPWVVRRPGF